MGFTGSLSDIIMGSTCSSNSILTLTGRLKLSFEGGGDELQVLAFEKVLGEAAGCAYSDQIPVHRHGMSGLDPAFEGRLIHLFGKRLQCHQPCIL